MHAMQEFRPLEFNLELCHFSTDIVSGIPDEVQYFAWAPVGNKLVNLDRKIIWFTQVVISDHIL